MNMQHGSAVHLQDEELVLLLDREAVDEVRSAWDEHVASCLPCSERLSELEHASTWLSDNIPALDSGVEVDEFARARAVAEARRAASPPTAPRAVGFTWARAAAAAGLLLIAGMTAQPVRAWVFDGFERLVGRSESAAPVAVAPTTTAAGATLAFQPTERVFRIEIDRWQAAGAVSIRMVDGAGATAQVMNGGEESVSVLPAGLLIDNLPASVASYEIELPRAIVRAVQVIVGGEVVLERAVTESTDPIVESLAAEPTR